jgi:hypothetical protein
VLQGLRTLGVRIPAGAADAYMQLWRFSGWLIGMEPELLVATEAEGERVVEVIAATQADPDEDSHSLTRALLDAPVRLATTPREIERARRLRQFSSAMCRELIGDARADALGVPGNTWRFSLPIMRRLVSSVELVRERVPFGDVPAVWAGTRYWDRVAALGFAGATTEFPLPQKLSRAA